MYVFSELQAPISILKLPIWYLFASVVKPYSFLSYFFKTCRSLPLTHYKQSVSAARPLTVTVFILFDGQIASEFHGDFFTRGRGNRGLLVAFINKLCNDHLCLLYSWLFCLFWVCGCRFLTDRIIALRRFRCRNSHFLLHITLPIWIVLSFSAIIFS